MGRAMLSKSLIQSSVDVQVYVPSLLFDLRPNYGEGNEDNGDLLQKVRVVEGNTDTREKDISKLQFYLDAICSKAPGP